MTPRGSLAVLLFATLVTAGPAKLPTYPPLDAKAEGTFDRTWKRIASRPPDSGAREIYGFLLNAVAHDWRPDRWDAIIQLGEELHDRDPASPTFGNYRWYWREPTPNDRNAVEFSMQSASLVLAAYGDRVHGATREHLTAACALGAEGMLRHKVDVSYTNIFLMRAASCMLIGERIGRDDLVAQGREWLAQWFAYTRKNGIHEFSSPTYYGTDLTDLGALANFAQLTEVRADAERGLRLVWTDIAANWFAPFEGIAGAHSRDYGFLTGHGYLDQQLLRAGWITNAVVTESHETIDDLTFWMPPADLRSRIDGRLPRLVSQRWGGQPWEQAVHYVGRNVSLGSAGAGYGAQDKVLALTFTGGPKQPIAAFSLDYRADPYGRNKMGTADGHSKLTHLLPFVSSVQNGPEVLLVACYDPEHARNPAGGKAPIAYQGVNATFVLPLSALAPSLRRLGPSAPVELPIRSTLIAQQGHAAAALTFVGGRDDSGNVPRIFLATDGSEIGAARLVAHLADGKPRQPVFVAVWVRVTDDTARDFAAFQQRLNVDRETIAVAERSNIDISVHGLESTLRLVVDPVHERRLSVEGADPAAARGILTVNGEDVGGLLLAP